MMSLNFAFWMFVFLFAVVGAMRGWAKELLVMTGVILALFIISVMVRFIPPVQAFFINPSNVRTQFWTQVIIVVLLAFFAYQTPNIPNIPSARFARERLSDVLLGFFLGGLNGFLIVGTLWFFIEQAGYPFPDITPPPSDLLVLDYLPPKLLILEGNAYTNPNIFFAVAVSFLFVLVVFI
jgi:uncharacterized membrane protein required for colicin V production